MSAIPSLVVSEDGSHTLYVSALDEHYHSTHGAIQESTHVFIEAGLKVLKTDDSPIRIFEVGFGTGLNAFLSLLRVEETKKPIYYYSIELYPLAEEIVGSLNYPDQLNQDSSKFKLIHSSEWKEDIAIGDNFTLHKENISLIDFKTESQFHLVFFDAFAPEKQEELWSEVIFSNMFKILMPGGILVTYCAKGQVRRNMIAAGFTVERIPGPPGKRQMMRARKF